LAVKIMTTDSKSAKPVVLTIAGFDPSGGAGIVADIQAFTSFGCLTVAAVTSLTFQNANTVFGAAHQSEAVLREQLNSILAASRISGVKTGMLPTSEIVREVVKYVGASKIPAPVVDPVFRSTSGYSLVDDEAWDLILKSLMPLARIITPNIPEAERITGLQISDEMGMRRAAQQIRAMGARAVLIKGGHLGAQEAEEALEPPLPPQAIDVLDDEGELTVFRNEWIEGPAMRGTGCRLSAAITAGLANGLGLKDSIAMAKRFVADVLRQNKKRG
jgi:hydroxymethylpyrimidine kinase/phosphomethylpyrimidine kinase